MDSKVKKRCAHCNKVFLGSEEKLYCSNSCRSMAYRKRKEQEPESIDLFEILTDSDDEFPEDSDTELDENYSDDDEMDTSKDMSHEYPEGHRIENRVIYFWNDEHCSIEVGKFNNAIDDCERNLLVYIKVLSLYFGYDSEHTQINPNSILRETLSIINDNYLTRITGLEVRFCGINLYVFCNRLMSLINDKQSPVISVLPKIQHQMAEIIEHSIQRGDLQKCKIKL